MSGEGRAICHISLGRYILILETIIGENLMCRNIRKLRSHDQPPTDEEIRDAALQFVRKVSGYRVPSKANRDVFERAVGQVAKSVRALLDNLETVPMTLLIKNGTLVTAGETFQADLLVEGEKIACIGADLAASDGAEVIDARDKLVMPGGVDVHCHFDLPMFNTVSSDDHYTGHKAAAFGGTTTTIDFISQDHPSLRACVDAWHARVGGKAAVDYSFHMNITRLYENTLSELPVLLEEGISSIKVFTAYNNRLRLPDGDIFRVMRAARELGLLTLLHAENGDVIEVLVAEALAAGHTSPEWHARTRPAWGAVEAVLRGASLSAQSGAPLYVVHMNAGGEVDQLAYARQHGLAVMGETCPQYLLFNDAELLRPDGAKWVCSPPVRTTADQQRLWQGLTDSTIQVVATDHCAFFYDGSRPILYEGQPVAIPGKELGRAISTASPTACPAWVTVCRCCGRMACAAGPDPQPVRRPHRHQPGAHLRALSA